MTDDTDDKCFQDQCHEEDETDDLIRTIDEEHSFNQFIHKSLIMGKLAKTKIAKKSFIISCVLVFIKPPMVAPLGGINTPLWF